MIEDYDFIKIMKTFRKYFFHEDYMSPYCEPYGCYYWLLIGLITHFYTPYRKKQIVRFEKVEEFIYNRLIDAGYNETFRSSFCGGFDSDLLWAFRDFLCVLKLLSETDSDELKDFIFLKWEERIKYEERIYTFQKIKIPEDGSEIMKLNNFFDITFITVQDNDERGNMQAEYKAVFCKTNNGEIVECDKPIFYSHWEGENENTKKN